MISQALYALTIKGCSLSKLSDYLSVLKKVVPMSNAVIMFAHSVGCSDTIIKANFRG